MPTPDADHLTTEQPSRTLEIQVCLGATCSITGGRELADWCRSICAADLGMTWSEVYCTGNCEEAPVVCWNGVYMTETNPAELTGRLIDESWFV